MQSLIVEYRHSDNKPIMQGLMDGLTKFLQAGRQNKKGVK